MRRNRRPLVCAARRSTCCVHCWRQLPQGRATPCRSSQFQVVWSSSLGWLASPAGGGRGALPCANAVAIQPGATTHTAMRATSRSKASGTKMSPKVRSLGAEDRCHRPWGRTMEKELSRMKTPEGMPPSAKMMQPTPWMSSWVKGTWRRACRGAAAGTRSQAVIGSLAHGN